MIKKIEIKILTRDFYYKYIIIIYKTINKYYNVNT